MKVCDISRKQLYRREWSAMLRNIDFSCIVPLAKAVDAVLNEIIREADND